MTTVTSTVSDLNAMVAGQGGDGSLTVITLLGNLLGRRGFHLYTAREVASRIKGGHAAALGRLAKFPPKPSCIFDREPRREGYGSLNVFFSWSQSTSTGSCCEGTHSHG